MNFLAHIYLSGNSDDVKIGNFIGDYVKGKDFLKYPELIKKGIILHRDIDTFTDTHHIVRQSKLLLTGKYHKYAGIIIDIFYDHFLSANWNQYSDENLDKFINSLHNLLRDNIDRLPPEVQSFLPRFIENNWINAYTTVQGIEVVLKKMSTRTSLPDQTTFAIKILNEHYNLLRRQFMEYFPELVEFVTTKHGIKL